MASITQDPSSGRYYVRFRYAGTPYKRSLGTMDKRQAIALRERVNETIRDIKRGRLKVPEDAEPGLFILSDGTTIKKAETPEVRTVDDLFRVYEQNLPAGAKEESTLVGERIHMKHLRRHLGTQRAVRGFQSRDLQTYIKQRSKESWHGKPISGDTIRKEITTFRLIWNWAVEQGHLSSTAPVKGLQYPKRDEREPFMTWDEIEKRIARGGIPSDELESLWECLYLTGEETDEVLDYVDQEARYSFIYPMIAFAALTGARRSEILRSRVDDFKFDEGLVQIREKKKRRDRRITFRHVELSPRLVKVMQAWFQNHPGGSHTIAAPPIVRGKQRLVPEPLTVYEAHDHFKRSLARGKWQKIRGFHVFRHSFASNAARAGVPEAIIDAWMGHQTPEMRNRYRHLFPEHRRSAIELVFGGTG